MSNAMEEVRQLEKDLQAFQKIENDIQTLQKNKQQLLTQKNENEMVKEELEFVTDDTVLYKLVGPCMVKQDREEVSSTVTKRLEYIANELKANEVSYQNLLKEREKQRDKVVKLQQTVASRTMPTK